MTALVLVLLAVMLYVLVAMLGTIGVLVAVLILAGGFLLGWLVS